MSKTIFRSLFLGFLVSGLIFWGGVSKIEAGSNELIQTSIIEDQVPAIEENKETEVEAVMNSEIGSEKVTVHVFWSETCPHCAKEKEFLATLQQKYDFLEVRDYEVTRDKENIKLLKGIGDKLHINIQGVPFTVIGEEYLEGYGTDETTGKWIEEQVVALSNRQHEDLVDQCRNVCIEMNQGKMPEEDFAAVSIPFLGEVDPTSLSLPVLTFVIALLDGFNPCAMWALLFLISLLLGMKDRRRMWILGVAFIATSGFVYFLFMSAWLSLFLFLGFIIWVRLAVGGVALGAGIHYLRDFWKNKDGACSLEGNEKKKEVFGKLKKIAMRDSLWIALLGIIGLAFAVNLVELICSAGLPAVYTQVLTMAELPVWQYYLYLFAYIVIFMIDDLVVFFIAMTTLKAVGIEGKYARYSHLLGGILMLVIGVLMIFKPEWLMFG